MKLKMAKNSLFAVLLRSKWWISLGLGVGLGAAAAALVPKEYVVIGALSGFPFIVIAGMAAWRGRGTPSEDVVERTAQVLGAMNWRSLSQLLQAAFERDGYTVQRLEGRAYDFEIERAGRRMLVAARRWKAAHLGVEPLRALQAAREAGEVPDALVIAMGELSSTARQLAASERIAVWRAPELAQKLRGLLPPANAS